MNERGVEFEYREYTDSPLTRKELRALFTKLKVSPGEALRARDAKTFGLKGNETDQQLIELMAKHPTLLQRPIGVKGNRAILGRPPEKLLELS